MAQKFANAARSTLASSITNVATSLTVATGEGSRFPALSAGDWFYAVLQDATNLEIVKVEARSGDTLSTITRAQQGTTAAAFSAGAVIGLRPTAADMKTPPTGDVVGTTDTQTLSGKTLTALKETKTAPSISAGTLTIDCSAGTVFAVSLNANITTLSFTNVPATGTAFGLTLLFTADGTQRTITWGAAVKWPGGTGPTMTATSGKVDTMVLLTHDGGTTWYAYNAGQNA